MIEALDALIDTDLKDFMDRSKQFGGTIAEQVQLEEPHGRRLR